MATEQDQGGISGSRERSPSAGSPPIGFDPGRKFTPGPWTASVEPRPLPARGHWYVVLDAEENGLGEFYGEDHDTNTANVRLAAAAPELLKALRKLSFAAQTSGGTAGRDEQLCEAIDYASEVLAAINGEQVSA